LIWVDWVIVGIIGLSAAISLIRGFVREALSIVIWILALWAAFRFTTPFAKAFLGSIDLASVRLAVAALILIISILVLGSMLSWLVGRLMQSTGLSGTDRLLGAVFGALRGLVTVTALIAVASWTPLCQDPWWRQSQLIPSIETLAIHARDFLPGSLREIIGSCREHAPTAAEAPPTAAT
jgi:membrane protein required for colicin V production